METTRYYDYNIWSQTTNELCLTAYRLVKDDIGFFQTDTSGSNTTIRFTFPEDTKEIEYLLQDLAINHYPFTDYDTWEDSPATFNGITPPAIQEFLDNLPEYTVYKLGEK